jgi:hypothetical protein
VKDDLWLAKCISTSAERRQEEVQDGLWLAYCNAFLPVQREDSGKCVEDELWLFAEEIKQAHKKPANGPTLGIPRHSFSLWLSRIGSKSKCG